MRGGDRQQMRWIMEPETSTQCPAVDTTRKRDNRQRHEARLSGFTDRGPTYHVERRAALTLAKLKPRTGASARTPGWAPKR